MYPPYYSQNHLLQLYVNYTCIDYENLKSKIGSFGFKFEKEQNQVFKQEFEIFDSNETKIAHHRSERN
jgi:hypothetical protein